VVPCIGGDVARHAWARARAAQSLINFFNNNKNKNKTKKKGQNLYTVPYILFKLFPTKNITCGQIHISHVLLAAADQSTNLTIREPLNRYNEYGDLVATLQRHN
jgi:hypothetical protein